MRRPIPLPENDNGTPEEHLAAATIALHAAIKGHGDTGKLVKAILALTHPAGATQP